MTFAKKKSWTQLVCKAHVGLQHSLRSCVQSSHLRCFVYASRVTVVVRGGGEFELIGVVRR
jgi:hypothetical protein